MKLRNIMLSSIVDVEHQMEV